MSINADKEFKNAFVTWNATIQRYLLAKGATINEVAEFTQECFDKLRDNYGDITADRVGPFLFQTAKNLTARIHEKQKLKLEFKTEIEASTNLGSTKYFLNYGEFKERFENGIDTMNQESKEVFLLNRYANKSYEEIANLLDLTIEIVEQHMGLAIIHLSEQRILN